VDDAHCRARFCRRRMGVQAACPSCSSFLPSSPFFVSALGCIYIYIYINSRLLPSDAAPCVYIYIYIIPAHMLLSWLHPCACACERLPSHALCLICSICWLLQRYVYIYIHHTSYMYIYIYLCAPAGMYMHIYI